MTLADSITQVLTHVRVQPRRLLLDTGTVRATVPLLRGVWGAALHDLDAGVYSAVFHPEEQEKLPAYVLRPAPPDRDFAPSIEWVLIGDEALERNDSLWLAWGMAMERGLGAEREPFWIRKIVGLDPDGRMNPDCPVWPLSQAVWPLPNDAESTPCRLTFDVPLCFRRKGKLLLEPGLEEIVVRAGRRIEAFLAPELQSQWYEVRGEAIERARSAAVENDRWRRMDLVRYSGTQERDFDVHGVAGSLDLPEGPGPLWPLLAALQWLHVGRSTSVGLGQLRIEPLLNVSAHRLPMRSGYWTEASQGE